MKVVLYLRYSSDKQTEQSIEGQQRICTEYCNRNQMEIVNIYIDRALSASKNIDKRESFMKMIRDSEKHTFQAVIVYKLDRFARNRYDSAIYKNRLKKNGVKVISATENISDNPEGIILESVLEGMAEFYSMELSQKVTRGMFETAQKCHSCGGRIPLGYKIKNKKYVLDPLTAPLVFEAFERYANGETITQLCTSFNSRGLRTATGAQFNKNSFRKIFRNERYIGTYIYKDTRIENGIPPIVSKEVFKTVQKKLQANATAPAKAKAHVNYLLSGKLFCGHCSSPMIGESGISQNGQTHYYYKCSSKKRNHDCSKKTLKKDFIEKNVIEDALELFTPENIDIISNMAIQAAEAEAAENKLIPALKAEISELEKGITNLLNLVQKGSTSESLLTRLDELEKQKKATEQRLKKEKETIVKLDKSQLTWFLKQFADQDPANEHHRRQIFEMLVNSVTVWDEPDGSFVVTVFYNISSCPACTFKCSDNPALVTHRRVELRTP